MKTKKNKLTKKEIEYIRIMSEKVMKDIRDYEEIIINKKFKDKRSLIKIHIHSTIWKLNYLSNYLNKANENK